MQGKVEPAEGGTEPRVVITGAVQFNARRKPWRALDPCFSVQSSSNLDDLLNFENIEVPGWQGRFTLEQGLVSVGLDAAPAVSTVYDASLRPTKQVNADGTFSSTRYEPLVVVSRDEGDSDPAAVSYQTPILRTSDGLGRLIRVEETTRLNDDGTPGAELRRWATQYTYNLNNQLTSITDSQGNRRSFTYDGLKRRTSTSSPNRGTQRFVYDDSSNLIESTDAKGQRITCTYDGANRVLTADYHDEAAEFSYGRSPDLLYHYDVPLADLPQGVTWRQMAGVGVLAGIGFTMSLFVANLAFDSAGPLLEQARVAVLATSAVAGALGYSFLRLIGTGQPRRCSGPSALSKAACSHSAVR